jgi:D-lactate dehydrogenase
MKLFAYSYRKFDEAAHFTRFSQELGIELGWTESAPKLSNADLAAGYDCVTVITTPVDAALLDRFAELGVRMIVTRTIGYDHIDVAHAKEIGMHIANVSYTPECVADYTVMLMLMAIRKMKRIMQRASVNDFTLKGICGDLLCNRTVGVLGTGRIGRAVIRDLQGFGCKVYAYDVVQSDEVKAMCDYLPLDELLTRCDLFTLHMPLTDANFHMIGRDAIARMPEGSIVINTARGGLIDSMALIDALESGHLAAAGLDVVENEFNMYYIDRRSDVLGNRPLSILRDMPNVVVTPHMAFYTEQSIADMVRNSMLAGLKDCAGEDSPWRVV